MNARVERKAFDFIAPWETLRPLRDRILGRVLPLKLSQTIIADWKGSAVRCEIIACGPGRYPNGYRTGTKDGKPYRLVYVRPTFRPTEVRVGQIVHLGGMELDGYIFPRVYIGNEEHVIFQEDDIAAIEE
jgi:hypothetical protein